MSEREIYLECLLFVQNQSGGEWGDTIEKEDTDALVKFVTQLMERARP